MPQTAIQVENLSKRYRLGGMSSVNRTLREMIQENAARLLSSKNNRGEKQAAKKPQEFWALKDVNFNVDQGEVIGIIGRNGAGKSTLLKILSRITDPTTGMVKLHGRVGSLLEVGTGFHPELSGRENIYLNGSILGMRKTEINQNFDKIVEFAEVDKFLDTPVKRYSSGMYVRLAFAVAAHLNPEILIVDEVLAVGDAAFQKKCLGKMSDVAKDGRTVLFVSHNMAAVQSLCTRAIMIDQGSIAATGDTGTVVRKYLEGAKQNSDTPLAMRTDRQGNGALRFTDIRISTVDDEQAAAIQSGDDALIQISYQGDRQKISSPLISIGIFNTAGQCMMMLNNEMIGCEFEHLPNTGILNCKIPRLPLSPDSYQVNIHCTVNGQTADWVQNACQMNVEAGDYFGTGKLPPTTHGGILAQHSWKLAA